MTKFRILALASISLFLFVILVSWTTQVSSSGYLSDVENTEELETIKATVQAYFDARYRTFSTFQLENFRKLIYEKDSNSSWKSETDKLNVEIYHAQLYNLRYEQYEYFLNFLEIAVGPDSESANLSVAEGHDVVFEVSEPVVSKMRNRLHTISMRKENGNWMILSDTYDDYLWRIIKTTGYSTEELVHSIDESYPLLLAPRTSQKIYTDELETTLSTGIYPYDRDGAVDYAYEYWSNYNSAYFDFDPDEGYGGDCTNFVSQAIFEGGDATMAFPQNYQPGIGNPGWYYVSVNDRSKAWVEVNWFYTVTLILNQE